MSGLAKVEITIETRPGGKVARVTIDNVAKLNALSSPVMEAFVAALEKCGADPDMRAIVITGAGARAFVGGADIVREMFQAGELQSHLTDNGIAVKASA